MKKKKIKINYGNLFLLIVIIGFIAFGVVYLSHRLNNSDADTKTPTNTTNTKKETNEIVSHLEKLGYKEVEISNISKNLSKEDIMKIEKKYSHLSELSNIKYFHIENLERYENYFSKESNIETVVMNVNTNIDKEFYTDIKEVADPYDTLVLVNKYYALPSGIEPKNLVNIEGQRMTSEAADAMEKMVSDLRKEGLKIILQSGYRSEDTQYYLYNRYANNYGKKEADTFSARPNHSEHQTGLTMDLSIDGTLSEAFENTEQFKWLNENAHKYGYILRYKKDKVYMTGYTYEPWHYRYVGVEVATIIKNENLTFEEYYVKYKGLY